MPDPLDDQAWTAEVGNGIPYTELVKDGSPTFSIENDGTTLTRQLLVLWDQLDDAKNAFLGYPTIVANSWLSRSLPDSAGIFLNSQFKPYLYATKLSGQGYGMPPGANEGIHDLSTDFPIYRYAKLEVVYETLPYDVISDADMVTLGYVDQFGDPDESTLVRFVTVETRPGVEYLTLPQGGFRFVGPTSADGAVLLPGGPGKITPNYDLAITWHLVPRAAIGSTLYNPGLQSPPIDLCLGTANSEPFPACPAGSVNGKLVSLQYALISSGGSGYNLGDYLVVSGGDTPASAGLQVTSTGSRGAVTSVSPVKRGLYDSVPDNPVSVVNTSGGGSGATFHVTWGAGFPVGSLLMTGCEIRPIRSTVGDRLYDLVYHFKYLPQGQQFLYYQGTTENSFQDAGYFEVSTNGNTNLGTFNNPGQATPANIYPWADHTTLFRIPS